MIYLVTGVAGFIGRALANQLLHNGHEVLGIDNLSDYYSTDLKRIRLRSLLEHKKFNLFEMDINELNAQDFLNQKIDSLIHLAAQPGVRLLPSEYSKYVHSNLSGFINICKFVDDLGINRFLYASSSSVYGNSTPLPFREDQQLLIPESVYGYTKILNEKIAQDYFQDNSKICHLGLRFFTVYGEFGRPDMLYFKVLNALFNDAEIKLYGDGRVERDFTYVGDVIKSILKLLENFEKIQERKISKINIGGGKPSSMNQLISILERITKKKTKISYLPVNSKDMFKTSADFSLLESITNYYPETDLENGLIKVVEWVKKENYGEKLVKWSQ